jgi:uncharacterized protein YndB with AHSA1/START domain
MAGPRDSALSIDIAQELTLRASRSSVFAALTERVSSWWGPPYLSARATDVRLESMVGGLMEEIWSGKGGRLLATVTGIDPGQMLELTGPMHLGVVYGVVRFELDDVPSGTRLRFSHRGICEVTREDAARFAKGWGELLTVRLAALVEEGKELGIAATSRPGRSGKATKRSSRDAGKERDQRGLS